MIEKITSHNVDSVSNGSFRSYASMYAAIEDDFRDAVRGFGLDWIDGFAGCDELSSRASALEARGVVVANDAKSFSLNWISSACLACRLGVGSETFISSTQCPRSCYYCFNPNQDNYELCLVGASDMAADLATRHAQGARYAHLAVTGGEPLLHRSQTLAFLKKAKELYPDAHTRLYTSGWGLDEGLMAELRDAGLREIRFSVKTEDAPEDVDDLLEVIHRTTDYIPDVMVEMPVVPGELALMKDLLVRLDEFGVCGINLLELGYPLANAEEFAKRGLRIKAEPFRVLYDYSYAGGLPIAGSEEECLALLEFALDEGLSMGVHYCSMENKFTGQVFQQNKPHAAAFPTCLMSERDHFLKTAKVFGSDVSSVRALLASKPSETVRFDGVYGFLEFLPTYVPELVGAFPDMEVAISYGVVELCDGERALRELRIDRTTPSTFDIDADL